MTNLSKVADSDSWAWWALQGIIAIEAEARAAARKEVVDELRQRLPGYMDDLNSEERSGYTFAVHQFAAILDSLSTDTRTESESISE